ncbi:hypothetical protein M436DRAFT_78113 [Aureobasidium namibiae CBS 147.97]|uniref:Uncharacterized protein n=1 Tax=Aureobasidium namibiae CBS 147.97 TaxID=1043004 RepID=A0A074X3F2_9PEZI
MAQLRPPFAGPTHQDGGKDIPDDVTCTVTFRHLGYPDEHNIIMILPALDDAQGDGVLKGKEYYFRLPGDANVSPRPYFRTLALSAQQAAVRLVALQSPEHASRLVAPEYLFARFAWTVFAYSAQFLQQGVKRVLYIVRDGETSKQEVNGDQCTQLYLSRKSRSLSPSKRKRDDRGSVQEGECGTEEQEDEDEDDGRYRGRARLRGPTILAALEATESRSLLADDIPWLTDTSTLASDADAPSPADTDASPSLNAKDDLPVRGTEIDRLPA